MPLIPWSDAYSVNIRKIDDQHKRLVAAINELHEAVLQAKGAGASSKLLSDLLAYTRYHFTTEQELMQNYGYPDYEKQRAAHEGFAQKVRDLLGDLRAGESGVSIQLMRFLAEWLDEHIRLMDKSLGVYLNCVGKRILHADDSAIVRKVVHDALAPHGFVITQAGDARGTLRLIEEQPFDVVITDLNMPGVQGETMVGHLRRRKNPVPVIVLSSSITPERFRLLRDLGVSAFVAKSTDFRERLVQEVSKVIGARVE